MLEIAEQFEHRVIEGLQTPQQELLCLPTYIPITTIPPQGRALVMDFGGTNVRAAVVVLQGKKLIIEQGPVKKSIPLQRGVPMERETFLDSFSELITSLDPPQDLPLGYCFSYPAESTPDGDARLITWTKELFVKDTVGEKVGNMQLEHVVGYTPPVRCSHVVVVNDTVASLLSGLVTAEADGYIGLIVGTGKNMATIMEPEAIPKLPGELSWKEPLPVNLESGSFTPPYLTEWDDRLDAESKNPGHNRLEKAVSGVYLATLLKTISPESAIDPHAGSKAVVELAYKLSHASSKEQEVAQQILARSAKLVAASLAGLIRCLNGIRRRETICVAAEGGLFWGHPNYLEKTQNTLNALLNDLGLSHITVEFIPPVEYANLLGSAAAALSEHAL